MSGTWKPKKETLQFVVWIGLVLLGGVIAPHIPGVPPDKILNFSFAFGILGRLGLDIAADVVWRRAEFSWSAAAIALPLHLAWAGLIYWKLGFILLPLAIRGPLYLWASLQSEDEEEDREEAPDDGGDRQGT